MSPTASTGVRSFAGLVAAALAAVLSAGASAEAGQRSDGAPPQPGDPELAGFRVTVERTSTSIRFGCTAGCVWKQLDASCADETKCAATVSDDGLVVQHAPPSKTFEIRVTTTPQGYALVCTKGCAWKTVSVACASRGTCSATVNQFGKVDGPVRKGAWGKPPG